MRFNVQKRKYITRPVEKKNTTTAKSYRLPPQLLEVLTKGANEYGWNPSTFLSLIIEDYLIQMTGKRIPKSTANYTELQTRTFRLDNALIGAIAVASNPNGLTATDIIIACLEAFKKQ